MFLCLQKACLVHQVKHIGHTENLMEMQHVNSTTKSCYPKERLLFQRGRVLGSLALNDWLDSSQNSFSGMACRKTEQYQALSICPGIPLLYYGVDMIQIWAESYELAKQISQFLAESADACVVRSRSHNRKNINRRSKASYCSTLCALYTVCNLLKLKRHVVASPLCWLFQK